MGKKLDFSEDDITKMISLHNEGLLNREIAQIFSVSPSSIGRYLRLNNIPSKHPWLSNERKEQIVECYLECQNKTEVEKRLHTNSTTITDILLEYNIPMLDMSHVRQKYTLDEHYFDELDTAEKCYYFGFLMADGYLNEKINTLTIALQIRDRYIIEKFNNAIGSNRPITIKDMSKKNPNWSDQAVLSITNKHLKESLIKLGLCQNKSLIVEFPDSVPEKFYSSFILGYSDGDGSYSKNPKDKRIKIIGTESFCKRVQEIVKEKLNVNSSIMYCHGNKETTTRTFQIAGNHQVKKFLDWLYNGTDLYLERKYNIYKELYCNDEKVNINNSQSA